MPRRDRLLTLSECHRALRHLGLTSLDVYRAASPERLCELHRHRAEIARLVAEGHPDVMRALWPPDPEVWWLVALLATDPTARLLSVTRGPAGGAHTTLLEIGYSADDPDGEREAWRMLVRVLV
jgi:hypothetical protein